MIDPELLLIAYANGVFPMADAEGARTVGWYSPDPRAVLPVDAFRVPKNVNRLFNKGLYTVRSDTATAEVIRACAAPRGLDDRTWLSDELIRAYLALHAMGFVHSVECSDENGGLVGGLYGVSLGRAFFGESMFHRASGASNVALVHLMHHLRARGYLLHDTQFMTEHLARFGAVEIPRARYMDRLAEAMQGHALWHPFPSARVGARDR